LLSLSIPERVILLFCENAITGKKVLKAKVVVDSYFVFSIFYRIKLLSIPGMKDQMLKYFRVLYS
jgi:hypothetical protein